MTGDEAHNAWVSGYELGKAERVEADIEDQVHARLHRQALEALGMARRLARAKGPAWKKMIVWSGQADD